MFVVLLSYAKGLAERTLVPLEYVQLASQCLIRDALLQADSTGMALHPEPEAALNNGLEEVLERVGLAQLCSAGAKTRWDPTSFGEDAAVMETICRACG